jgi:YfiH family protein
MEPANRMSWSEKTITGTRVLIAGLEDVTMIFGLGPAAPAGAPLDRMHGLLRALSPTVGAIRWGEQVHGRTIWVVTSARHRPLRNVGCCDALITGETGLGLAVWTADCVPVLMAGNGAVAAVHSGWRGAALDVAGAVVRSFDREYGVPPARLVAALGPAISGPRYQVGPEVIEGLGAHSVEESRWRNEEHVDLRGFLAARLEALGVLPTAISIVGPCTASSPELASYRRDGAAAGRQWSIVYRSGNS